MSIQLYRTAWGLIGPDNRYASLSEFVDHAHADGYAGVEFPVFYLDDEPGEPEDVLRTLTTSFDELDMNYIALIATRPDDWSSYEQHLASFESQCGVAQKLGARKAAVHAGADSFGIERGQQFLEDCMRIAADHSIAPCFETHRARILYNPFACAELLERLPALRLTSDLSHWLLVVDRIPNDIMELFDLASERSSHLHARIGHEKSPQVTAPDDPAWSRHIELHRRWWQISVDAHAANGDTLSISPEFGPPPYMHAEPYTGAHSGDLFAANEWMREQLLAWFTKEQQ